MRDFDRRTALHRASRLHLEKGRINDERTSENSKNIFPRHRDRAFSDVACFVGVSVSACFWARRAVDRRSDTVDRILFFRVRKRWASADDGQRDPERYAVVFAAGMGRVQSAVPNVWEDDLFQRESPFILYSCRHEDRSGCGMDFTTFASRSVARFGPVARLRIVQHKSQRRHETA